MSALITTIVELPKNFFDTPIKCNEYFAVTNDYQKYCYNSNLLTRCSIGIVVKEAMLVHDIFFNLIAGSIKLLAGGIKGLCAIPAGAFNAETGHQRSVKESIVHFGFSAFYTADMIISLSNINNSYPQNLLEKIETTFAKFLEIPNKKVVVQYVSDSKIEEELRKENRELARAAAAAAEAEEAAIAAADQYIADINQAIGNAEEAMREPSTCEKIVDRALYPDTKAPLENVASIINGNQREKESICSKPQELLDKSTPLYSLNQTEEDWDLEREWDFEKNLGSKNYMIEDKKIVQEDAITYETNKSAATSPLIQKKINSAKAVKKQSKMQKLASLPKKELSAQERYQLRQNYGKALRKKPK